MIATFSKASCVAVGAFNVYVIQPTWLRKVKILPADKALFVETNLSEPGFRFRFDEVIWTISPTRIAVESTDVTYDCGRDIAKVLSTLPHTPLKAIGNNAHYLAPIDDLDHLPELSDLLHEVPTDFQVAQRTVHIGLKKEGVLYNLQAAVTSENVVLQCNVHFDVEHKEMDAACEFATRFVSNRQESEELINQVLKVQIEHDVANT